MRYFAHFLKLGQLACATAVVAITFYFPQTLLSQDVTRPPSGPTTRVDDSVSYLYGPLYRTPYVTTPPMPFGANIARNILEVTHRDSSNWGGNFIDLYIRRSSGVEPAVAGSAGALELYFVERTDLSLHKLLDKPIRKARVLRDFAFEAGVNLNTKNSQFAPEERTLYIGPAAKFKLPHGLINVAAHYRQEWNHEGILGKDEQYNPDWNVEVAWSIPFHVAKRGIDWSGFDTQISPKGVSSLGTQTAWETLLRSQVAVDLGQLFGRREPLGTDLGVGLEYWHNEYGQPAISIPGAEELTPVFMITVHLPHGAHEIHRPS